MPAHSSSQSQVLDGLDRILDEQGLEGVMTEPAGNLSRPRRLEIAAAINRWRALPMCQVA